jgi:hypothetical protein
VKNSRLFPAKKTHRMNNGIGMCERLYTTAKTTRLLCALIIALGVNIIYREIGWRRSGMLVYSIIFLAGHAGILGTVLYYLIYGVKKKPGADRAVITLILALLLAGILLSVGNTPVLKILTSCYILLILFLLIIMTTKKDTGDNVIRLDARMCLDSAYFDRVNGLIHDMEVSFPLDIENYKYDRGKGYINRIGLVKSGKYAGRCGAAVKSNGNGKIYLCPLDHITVNESFDNDVIVAEKGDEVTVKMYTCDKDKSKITVIGNGG